MRECRAKLHECQIKRRLATSNGQSRPTKEAKLSPSGTLVAKGSKIPNKNMEYKMAITRAHAQTTIIRTTCRNLLTSLAMNIIQNKVYKHCISIQYQYCNDRRKF